MKHNRPIPKGLNDLTAIHYNEIRGIARRYVRNENRFYSLNATALAHDAYIRLAEGGPGKYQSRGHFFGTIARSMRQILVDHARKRVSHKRGAGAEHVPFTEMMLPMCDPEEFLAFDRMLATLNNRSRYLTQIVELRIFAGLTEAETATVLGKGRSTVRRDFRRAKEILTEIDAACE